MTNEVMSSVNWILWTDDEENEVAIPGGHVARVGESVTFTAGRYDNLHCEVTRVVWRVASVQDSDGWRRTAVADVFLTPKAK